MSKTGFSETVTNRPKQKKKSNPWSFDTLPYDERSGPSVGAGTNYGVGHNQPVGHTDKTKKTVAALPYGRVKTMDLDATSKTQTILVDE